MFWRHKEDIKPGVQVLDLPFFNPSDLGHVA